MKYILLIATLALSGCAVIKTPQVMGGSKADGIVELSYNYGGFEDPEVDWSAARRRAATSCSNWGYTGATPFGGTSSRCRSYNQYGCNAWTVTAKYQCTQ